LKAKIESVFIILETLREFTPQASVFRGLIYKWWSSLLLAPC